MDTPYISKNGEITSKKMLIDEIEKLLNILPSTHTILSHSLMNTLSAEDLENIRNNLLKKQQNTIADNKKWLFGLAND